MLVFSFTLSSFWCKKGKNAIIVISLVFFISVNIQLCGCASRYFENYLQSNHGLCDPLYLVVQQWSQFGEDLWTYHKMQKVTVIAAPPCLIFLTASQCWQPIMNTYISAYSDKKGYVRNSDYEIGNQKVGNTDCWFTLNERFMQPEL